VKKPLARDKAAMRRYGDLLNDVKARIVQAQRRALMSANAEMIRMYWDIGHMVADKQETEGWGSAVIPRLSIDLRNDLPDTKGFSERNIGRMIAFFRAYPNLDQILPQPVAKNRHGDAMKELLLLVSNIPWGHNVLLMEKVKDMSARLWYMDKTLESGWSRAMLTAAIKSNAHNRQGAAVNNFDTQLPQPHAKLTKDTLKDPYIFDFLTLDKPFREREFEVALVGHLERFLLELGAGFAFVGRQVHLHLDEEDFYVDLLFYHLKLRSFIVVDLKIGPFKPEYASKINFYCNVVDDQMRHGDDNPTIGLILCQDKKKVLASMPCAVLTNP
jgi:predicted nuclease of restriction endonuclease-like (RecB) superfamily